MPAKPGASKAFDKLKNDAKVKQSFNKHKGDETKMPGGGDLPAGIDFGVAKLVDAKIDDHKDGDHKGKPYFYLAGVVVEPERYAGLRCNKTIRLYDYRESTVEDGIAKALNEMRKMEIDTNGLELNDWEAALEGLRQEAPHFRFRTWKGKKQTTGPYAGQEPMTNTDFKGVIANYTPGEGAGTMEVADDSEAAPDDDAGGETDGGGDDNWADKGAQADGGDQDLAAELQAALEERGLNPDDYPTWAEAGAALADYDSSGGSGEEGGEETADEAAEPWVPKVKDVYDYKEKGARKKEECEVTRVDVKGKKLDLKRISDKKVFKNLPWSNDPDAIGGQEIS